jgi:type IV pilus assembly protein PilF
MRRLLVAAFLAAGALTMIGCAASGPATDRDARAAEANTKLGIALLRQDEPQRAMQKLNKAIRQNPGSSDAHMVRALAFERLEKPDKAEDSYEESLSLDSKNAQALNNYGRFLCGRGELSEAQGYFDRAVDISTYETPEVPLTNAGICALRNGESEKAEDYLRRALKQNKKQARALLYMAEIRLEREQYMSARGYYERYLDAARQTPRSAWVGVRIASQLGNKNAVASYKQLLRNKFPDSKQTAKLLEWESNGRL